jgi:hypothetical protein
MRAQQGRLRPDQCNDLRVGGGGLLNALILYIIFHL